LKSNREGRIFVQMGVGHSDHDSRVLFLKNFHKNFPFPLARENILKNPRTSLFINILTLFVKIKMAYLSQKLRQKVCPGTLYRYSVA